MPLSASQHQACYEKWLAWLDRIKRDVLYMHHQRQIWREMKDAIVSAAGGTPMVFLEHYTGLYVDAQAIGVRRLADAGAGRRAVSLAKLINDVKNHREVMSLARYTELDLRHEQDEKERRVLMRLAEETYNQYWGNGSGELDRGKLQADLHRLKELSRNIDIFASQIIAHIQHDGVGPVPTFEDLDMAIDVVGEMFKRYTLLLTASTWDSLEPVVQVDWKATFRQPLFLG